jgi:Family of unknown function (DUF6308)
MYSKVSQLKGSRTATRAPRNLSRKQVLDPLRTLRAVAQRPDWRSTVQWSCEQWKPWGSEICAEPMRGKATVPPTDYRFVVDTAVVIQWPEVLSIADDKPAVAALKHYYGNSEYCGEGCLTGAYFDGWDSTGTRASDIDRFTADDLVAVTFLTVAVPARAARRLLDPVDNVFNGLLKQICPDRELADEVGPLDATWPAWQLEVALRGLKLGIGRTIATKLLARKRPRLLPIWDTVIADVTHTHGAHLEPVRQALRQDGKALHHRLVHLRKTAGLPTEVSALRVLDVLAWTEGKRIGRTM